MVVFLTYQGVFAMIRRMLFSSPTESVEIGLLSGGPGKCCVMMVHGTHM